MKYKTAAIWWIGFLLFLCVPVPGAAQENDVHAKISRANELYHEKNYAAAGEIYQSLAENGLDNGYLYYNLGNTYMRLGETGKAILNYLRARTLIPRDENLDANLRYAIQQTVDQIELPEQGILRSILFWIQSLNSVEHLQLLAVCNAVFWLVSLGGLFYRKPAWTILRQCTLGILILVSLSAGTQLILEKDDKTGVVLKKKIDIKSDKGAENVTLFQLHEGAIVTVGRESEGWAQISLSPDKSGWVPRDTIGALKKTGV